MHQLSHLRRDRDQKPSAIRPRLDIRAIFGAAVVASILTLAVGCNKHDAEAFPAAKHTSLAGKPKTLMFIFGDRSDPRVLPLATLVNGEIKQTANLNQMIWSVAEQISKISEAFELMPGDIIYSGTPENVGPVVKDDVILCHIDKLPELSIKIV